MWQAYRTHAHQSEQHHRAHPQKHLTLYGKRIKLHAHQSEQHHRAHPLFYLTWKEIMKKHAILNKMSIKIVSILFLLY